jgi:hypothetical protein
MPGVVNTTHTFATNEVITSTLMNNIIDETFFISDAIDGGTLTVTGAGKLKVSTSGITSNEIGSNAVTANAILDGVITNAKISASAAIALSKLAVGALPTDITVTTANIVDASVTTAKIVDANVTAPKLNGTQTGTAPIFGVRAWANFNAKTNSDLAGTYSRSSTTVTITVTSHGLIAGNLVFIDYTVGVGTVAPDGLYQVASVTDANTFTVTSNASVTGTHTGTVELKRKTIRASGNVSCVSAAASGAVIPPTSSYSPDNGYYVVNFSVAMPSSNFSVSGTCSENGAFATTSGNDFLAGYPYNPQSAVILTMNVTPSGTDCLHNSISIIG